MTQWPYIDSAVIYELQIYNIVLVVRVACRKSVAGWNSLLMTFVVFCYFLFLPFPVSIMYKFVFTYPC